MTNININTLVGDFSGILHSILCELGRIIGTYMLGVKGSVKLTNFFLHNSLRLSNSYNNNSNNMYLTKIDPKPLQSQLSMNIMSKLLAISKHMLSFYIASNVPACHLSFHPAKLKAL